MTADRGDSRARREERARSKRVVIEAVRNRRRRYALYYLRERSRPTDLDDLTSQVSAWEAETTTDRVSPAAREAVGASLRETHLPYLAERGLVRYDRRRDRATYCGDDPALAVYLANDPRTTVRWHRVYLLLTAVVAVFVGLVWVGVSPLARVDPVAVAAAVVALFAAVAVAHWYDVHRWRQRTEGMPPDFVAELEEDKENGVGGPDDADENGDGNRSG